MFNTVKHILVSTLISIVGDIPKRSELEDRDIIDNIAADYSIVGTCLLDDDYGNKIKRLEEEYRSRSVTELVREIIRLWTNGKGATPRTWGGLVICLLSAKLNRLADEITSAYCVEKRTDSYTRSHRSSAATADPDEGSIKESQIGFQTEIHILLILCCTFFIATIVVVTLFVKSRHSDYSPSTPSMRLLWHTFILYQRGRKHRNSEGAYQCAD